MKYLIIFHVYCIKDARHCNNHINAMLLVNVGLSKIFLHHMDKCIASDRDIRVLSSKILF